MDQDQLNHIKGAVEALLFVSEKPVGIKQLREAVAGTTPQDIKKAIESLQDDYDSRSGGMVIIEVAEGYQMLSNATHAEYIRNFYKTRHKEKLSRPALETLAIVAYKQPVTRSDVEQIRGVNSDGVMTHLLDKGLIKLVGRKEVPGRPYLHGTTTRFLEYFGLKSIQDLPNLEDFPSLQEQAAELEQYEEAAGPSETSAETPKQNIDDVLPDLPPQEALVKESSRIEEHLSEATQEQLAKREEVLNQESTKDQDNPDGLEST